MIERFSVEVHNRQPEMTPRGYGPWVKHQDYEDIRAQLAVTEKALELACKFFVQYNPGLACEPVRDTAYWLHKASKEGVTDG